MSGLPQRADVVIVGGGVIGLAVARALAQRGLCDVLLIERAGLGAEASSAAAGMLAPQAEADRPDDLFYLTCQSRDMYPAFAAGLREETGIDVELETAGTLYLAFNEQDATELERRYEWQSRAGLPISILSPDEARQLESSVSQEVQLALKFPLDTQVENRRLLVALATSNEQLGVKLATETAVTSLKSDREKVCGVETSRGFVATEQVVIAGGAWSSMLQDKALPDLGIEPVRGQMLCLAANPQIFSHVIYSPRGYLVPRRDGRLLAGSTTEHAGYDKRVTAAGIKSITSAALEITSRIGSLAVTASWAGLRPRAADGLPVLGPCAEIAGVFYATGHYRNGILLAPITAELIAEAVVNKVSSRFLNIFSPDRFKLAFVN
jgi:glycine oxidase